MNNLHLPFENITGHAGWIKTMATEANPSEYAKVEAQVLSRITRNKRAIEPFQASVLYAIAKAYNSEKKQILEVGTALGYSCAFIASAAPKAQIVTLNPKQSEAALAEKNLSKWRNVRVIRQKSLDFFQATDGVFKGKQNRWDFIFIDGDHRNVRFDFLYYFRLKPGGLIFFHDYSPEDSRRPCAVVYDAVNEFAVDLGLPCPDLTIMCNEKVGMAGIYKRGGKND